jgi:hypothetical protein
VRLRGRENGNKKACSCAGFLWAFWWTVLGLNQ